MSTSDSVVIKFGTANGQDIIAGIASDGLAAKSQVTLAANYYRAPPLGFPDPNPDVAPGTSVTNRPMTIWAGSTFTTFAPEAAALLAAGAASSVLQIPTLIATGSVAPMVMVIPPWAVAIDGVLTEYPGPWVSKLFVRNDQNITAFASPDLVGICGDGLSINGNGALTSVSLSALAIVSGGFDIAGNEALTSISLPALATVDGGISIRVNAALTTLSFPALTNITFVLCDGNALSQASVDGILEKLSSLDGTGGTTLFQNRIVDLSGGTNATPSSAGLAAKATLVSRDCTVINN